MVDVGNDVTFFKSAERNQSAANACYACLASLFHLTFFYRDKHEGQGQPRLLTIPRY